MRASRFKNSYRMKAFLDSYLDTDISQATLLCVQPTLNNGEQVLRQFDVLLCRTRLAGLLVFTVLHSSVVGQDLFILLANLLPALVVLSNAAVQPSHRSVGGLLISTHSIGASSAYLSYSARQEWTTSSNCIMISAPIFI